jgi:membrane protease YdiL (CAAX protease family)
MGRSRRTPTFSYGQRWAFLPTIALLVVVFAILFLDPSPLWAGGVDERTRQIGLLLSGGLAIGFAVALVVRRTQPSSTRPDRPGG